MNKIKVLTADDETVVRQFIRAVIERQQLPVNIVLEADNGTQALKLALLEEPELIFLDIRMPGMNGLEVAEEILKTLNCTRIVILSAYDEFEYARKAFRAGVLDYLLKPVRPEQIVRLIWGTAQTVAVQPRQTERKHLPLISAVQKYIAEHRTDRLSLPLIAKAVFVSPYHLSRVFKKQTGQGIMEYVQKQRLILAAQLLRDTDFSVTEVADRSGFRETAYLSTCFKREFGLSPLQYRKQQEDKKI